MSDNIKILKNYILYFLLMILICIVGVSGVFADTTDIGYISDDTQVLVGIPNSGAPITLNQYSSINNSNVNAIWFNINYNFEKDKLYQLEISTPGAYLVNINTFGIEYNGGVCNFHGYSDANTGYPKIYFKCLQDVNYLSISLRNWDNNTIVSSSNFKWSYTYLKSFTDDDEIDLGPVISNQNQNTQDIINNQNIINNKLIESNQQLLGECNTNIFSNNNVVNLFNISYHNGKYIQSQADTNSNPNLKLQYRNNGTYVGDNDYRPKISVNTFKYTFVKNSSFNQIVFGLNGSSLDTTITYNVSNLTNQQLYSLIFDIENATNGQVIISNIMLIKGNSLFNEYIPEGESKCISKIDSQINNAIQNTQDIINNQNANTDKEIDSQQVCTFIDSNYIDIDGAFLNRLGNVVSFSPYGISKYIEIYDKDLSVNEPFNVSSDFSNICYYSSDKSLISCENISNSNELIIPDNTFFIRFSIYKPYNRPILKLCQNGNQALNDSITGLNDSLNDDDSSGATSEASEFFNSFSTNTFGLTSIITAPLNLIQSLTSSSCSELHLPLPYLNNKYLDLPCMTSIYQNHFGSFFTMYQTITYGIIAYWVCVRIFNQVKDFKNPEHDEIEVVDL